MPNQTRFARFSIYILGAFLGIVLGFILGVASQTPDDENLFGRFLSPNRGGRLLRPATGWVDNNTNVTLATATDNVGVGTSTPGEDFAIDGEILISSTATSTLIIHSEEGASGGCIQFEGPASSTFRAYATTTGPLILESGACR